ncbi:hypothetical protein [Pseudaminobacter sp. NGMCC 1.201702]|uniref:hypothetical protein n=1 Tax=Pseudaminobacter sp. NGMCC 1.201702 TaxID=3391825 RepID=UPI0039F12B03
MTASPSFGTSACEASQGPAGQGDPVLALCESWRKTHEETLALCRKQQRLETYLAKAIGFPCVKVRLRNGEVVTVHSIESLSHICSPEDEAIWRRALADFAVHQARWNAADAGIGYSQTQELERQSEAAERAILDDLPLAPASSMQGVLAKLSVILRDGEHWEEPDDFPWPHIRSVLDDLARLHHIDPATIAGSDERQNNEHQKDRGCCFHTEPINGRSVE